MRETTRVRPTTMPPQDYQVTAALAARDMLDSTAGSAINGKSIALIIFVAIVPVLIAAGAVSWLLCCYSRGRGCGRRNKDNKSKANPASPQHKTASGTTAPAAQNAPNRPAPAHTRNDSLMSKNSNEKVPTLPKGFV
ncbi:uncharacterized protein N0V89_006077 [Didymosphaeria variabile]|uniref:Uncharacterized protein n=1 Tax=Didymosphaeria variabile TaxID=1932322 RepID=A0A9W8XLW9_9PLEO|nr:uncharacterized protein N0V89_006077 [Didymosphaeria variabile]KAJ4354342.1 hypothetical protein N0V89_006077 [Didymosphaeria variabile]